jgi:hypothetical protein
MMSARHQGKNQILFFDPALTRASRMARNGLCARFINSAKSLGPVCASSVWSSMPGAA